MAVELVGEAGLEPARLAARDPKSRVSAISPLAQRAQWNIFSIEWKPSSTQWKKT